jgi:CBS domain-containing protein
MKVKEIMTQPALVVTEAATLEEVARLILDHRIGGVPVINGQGKLSGIITESSFAAREKGIPFSTFRAPQVFGEWMGDAGVELIYARARELTAGDIMLARVITVTEEQPVEDAITLMLRHDINRVPVVRDGVPVGMIARHDLLRMLVNGPKGQAQP